MKPEGKSYEEPVIIPKVWELINGEHHLVPEKVSAYIRELEERLAHADKLRDKTKAVPTYKIKYEDFFPE